MAQTIKLKRSAVAGRIPTVSDLALGELGINTYDGKLYIKKDVGGTESIVEVGNEAIWKQYVYTAGVAQTVFTGADDNSDTLAYSANYIEVFLNGILLDPAVDYTATNNASVVLTSAPATGDLLQIDTFAKSVGIGDTVLNSFTGDNSTTAFTLSTNPGDENNTSVFIGGVYQNKTTYSVSGTTLTFSEAPATAAEIEVVIGSRNLSLTDIDGLSITGVLTADSFNITNDSTLNSMTVGRGGGNIDGNTAFGRDALLTNTTATSNTAFGASALKYTTTGTENTAVGWGALIANTTARRNVAVGSGALNYNDTGYENTAVGFNSNVVNTTGYRNTAMGSKSGLGNTTGNENVSIGYYTNRLGTTGSYNTALGSSANRTNVSGSYNTSIGFNAGFSLTGSNNTIIGSIPGEAGISDTVIIGAGTTERLRIDSTGNVGIGTSTPATALDVNGTVTATGGTSTNWNTAYGWGDHSTATYATQSYVGTAISNLVDTAPSTLDTLNELAAALGDDPNFATTTATAIGLKAPIASPSFTGTATIPTADINGGTIDGTVIGGTTAAAGSFTTVTALAGSFTNITATANWAKIEGSSPYLDLDETDDTYTTRIRTSSGNLNIQSYDGTTTTNRLSISHSDGVVSIPATLAVTGEIAANGGIALGDNDKATFGAGDDLQIYHDGSDSYIKEDGTGNLIVAADNFRVTNVAVSEVMIAADTDGAVTLYNNGSTKLATTATGIDVTGNVDISTGQLDLDPNYRVRWGASNAYSISSDVANYVRTIVGGVESMRATATGIDVTGDIDSAGLLKVGPDNTEYANNYLRYKSAGAGYIDHSTVGQDINFRVSSASSLDKTPLTLKSDGTTFIDGGNGYFRAGVGNSYSTGWNANTDTHSTWINFEGYLGGTTKFRDLRIGNGKQTSIVHVEGSTGHVGIGVSPYPWGADYDVIDFNTGGAIYGTTTGLSVSANLYFTGSAWLTKTTAPGTLYATHSGKYYWYNSVSAAAGTGAALTERMSLDTVGNLIVGSAGNTRAVLTPDAVFQSYYSTEAASRIHLGRDVGIGGGAGVAFGGGGGYALIGTDNTSGTNLYFNAGSNAVGSLTTGHQMMINGSNNYVGIGTSLPGALLDIGGAGAGGVLRVKGGAYNQVNIAHSSNSDWGMLLTNSDSSQTSGYHQSTSGVNSSIAVVNVANDALHFGTNNAPRMTINHNGIVGIGTTTPVAKLHIQGSGSFNHTPANPQGADFVITSSEMADNNAHSIMQLVSVRQSLSTGSGATGYLGFSTVDDSNGEGIRDAGRIAIVNETGTNRNSPTALAFWTNAGGTDTTAATEKMRIDASGHLLVGTTDDAAGAGNTATGISLRGGTDNRSFFSVDSNYVMHLNRKTNNGNILEFAKDGTGVGSIGSEGGDSLYIQSGTTSGSGLHFHPTGALVRPAQNGVTVDNVIDLGSSNRRFKNAYLSGGVYLGGTGAANHLDDYEEGTFTPTVTTAGGTVTYNAQQGTYVKVGNVVHIWVRVVANNTTSSVLVNLENLPFTALGYSNFYSGPTVGNAYNVSLGTGGTVLGGYWLNGAASLRFHSYGNNTGQLAPYVSGGFEIRMEASYTVS